MVDILNHLEACGDQMAYFLTTSKFKIYNEMGCFSYLTSKTSNLWHIATLLNHLNRYFVILQPYANLSFLVKIPMIRQK